jgi:hypothetical protein
VLWILIVITIALYSVVQTKISWYVLPVYPALAIEAGTALTVLVRNNRLGRFAFATSIAVAIAIMYFKPAGEHGNVVTNSMAKVARAASDRQGCLFLVGTSDRALESPTAVFYSDRVVQEMIYPKDAEELRQRVQESGSVDAIIWTDTAAALSADQQVTPVAHQGPLSYIILSKLPE